MLTERKKLFADYFLINSNGVESAKLAGYKSNNPKSIRNKASDLKKDKDVKAYLTKKMAEKDKDLVIQQDEVLGYLTNVIRGIETETNYFILKSGSRGEFEDSLIKEEVPIKARDRINACTLISRIYGMMNQEQITEPTIIIKNTIPRDNNDD